MSRNLRGIVTVVCVCLGQLALSGSVAVASTPHGTLAEELCPIAHVRLNVSYSCAAEFTLEGSNGYRITVSGDPYSKDSVQLSAETPSESAEYIVPGRVTADGIEARFGKLGSISVRFRPSGRVRRVRVPKKCFPKRPPVVTSRLGTFAGTIRFRGERGYTQVSARSARGGIGDPLANVPQKQICRFRESAEERQREDESVSLDASLPGHGPFFSAFRLLGDWQALPAMQVAPGDRFAFLVIGLERVGGMTVYRSAGALGPSEDFVFDASLSSATVRPPAPFSGSGSFVRNADGSTSWTGDLAVLLPGLGTVGLTSGKAELATVAKHEEQSEEEAKAR